VALYYPTALATVQDALLDIVALAYRQRLPAVADATELAAVTSIVAGNAIADRTIRFVTDPGACFIFRKWSTLAASASVIVPNDRGTKPGRWIRTSSPIQNSDGVFLSAQTTGYLKNAALWVGEMGGKDWDQRILANRPAFILKYQGEDKEWVSLPRGRTATKLYKFEIWAVSFIPRPDLEAVTGPKIAAEALLDPGVARIMGDLENLLDGLTGAQLDIYAGRSDIGLFGLDYCLVGPVTPAVEDYSGREYIWSAPLDVRVTVHRQAPTQPDLTTLTTQGLADELDYPVDTTIPDVGADDAST